MQGLLIGLWGDIEEGYLLTCNGLFHPRANVARLYLKRGGRGRGLISA